MKGEDRGSEGVDEMITEWQRGEGGGLVWNSWQKPSLFNTLLQCPVESRLQSDEEHRDALHPSVVLLTLFHKITQFPHTHAEPWDFLHLIGQEPAISTLFKILSGL